MNHTGTTEALAWRLQGACLDEDPELFFPPAGNAGRSQTKQAKAVCEGCPVIDQCRRWALDNRITDGVFGGLSEVERRNIWRSSGVRLSSTGRIPRGRFDLGEIQAALVDALGGDHRAARERLNPTERNHLATLLSEKVGRVAAAQLLRYDSRKAIDSFVCRDRQRTARLQREARAEAA